ncbi:NADPH-dependent glutamate synthase [Clostridium sp. 'deep sea']|uniref:NADPH-dependent glutamate synthase n=1 Tax=Clostridium sp. 'deep sea' TaxID=2779445 RepID=UPI00189689F6|nr:NADPH-dependent glutamate synthase [Clostridium sp. 'deep sea']QOR35529.1 NADPH-dependent glutamate synthase [Clostridium sp. 'deep sea']
MSKNKKVKMRLLAKKERISTFCEVALGFNEEEALIEANRCLLCKAMPCVQGCPVNVPIPLFITSIKEKRYRDAHTQIISENSLPAICGRVCPQEKQCEANCVRGKNGEPVAIGRLERFIGDWGLINKSQVTQLNTAHKVAIVGSGPAGLACAAELVKNNIKPVVFEALHDFGGVLRYGIPEFRLPKEILNQEIQQLKQLGVCFEKNVVIGKSLTIEDLMQQGYKAVFIGSGAGLPRFMGIPGENLNGVFSANEFLTRVNLMNARLFPHYKTPIKIPSQIAVIGGGNVALDVARVAKRLGAKHVSIVYRRGMKELPARLEEVEHAIEEDIEFMVLSQPIAVHGENKVQSLECLKMELGEPDSSGRRRPIVINNSNFTLKVDTVVIAVGQTPNPLIIKNNKGLKTNKWGGIVINNNQLTSIKNVYAGGDAVTGAATVISAMGAGKKAAKAIIISIKNNYSE